jgi:hypothetical protein
MHVRTFLKYSQKYILHETNKRFSSVYCIGERCGKSHWVKKEIVTKKNYINRLFKDAFLTPFKEYSAMLRSKL